MYSFHAMHKDLHKCTHTEYLDLKKGQKVFWSPSARAKPSETRKVCRIGDIHGRVTEGHMPRNEMCNNWMQEGHMYGKKAKGHVSF